MNYLALYLLTGVFTSIACRISVDERIPRFDLMSIAVFWPVLPVLVICESVCKYFGTRI